MSLYDIVIAGAGIVGLTVAYELKLRFPEKSIAVFEKEAEPGIHASGRNSGVLHAGFYYSADSLKAKFCVSGNQKMKEFCRAHGISVNSCGKLVTAKNKDELSALYELERRGKTNGANVSLIDAKDAFAIEPLVQTYEKALWSPDTASVDPVEVLRSLIVDLKNRDVKFHYNSAVVGFKDKRLYVKGQQSIACNYFINAAGLYADKIARYSGLCKNYTILPFKGLYFKYTGNSIKLNTHIYPVPNLLNPFLGVHWTKTVDGHLKIGPTSIPAFWRENYSGLSRFHLMECIPVLYHEARLFCSNKFNFRTLAFHEIKKYRFENMRKDAEDMINVSLDSSFKAMPAGIRAQLLDLRTDELLMDFYLESGDGEMHILNAVSPAFTCSFAFAKHVVERIKETGSLTKE